MKNIIKNTSPSLRRPEIAIRGILISGNGHIEDDHWSLKIHNGCICGNLKQWYVPPGINIYYAVLMDLISFKKNFEGNSIVEHFIKQWSILLSFLREEVGIPVTSKNFTSECLDRAREYPHYRNYKTTLSRVVAGAFAWLKYRQDRVQILYEEVPYQRKSNKRFYKEVLYAPAKALSSTGRNCATLARCIDDGEGPILLVGSTGVGKTEATKSAACEKGANLIKIEGHPGLDDRALFGSLYPDGNGSYQFVNGPLTQAFEAANEQKTVLLVDEFLRMDPLYHSIFIGILDPMTGREIKRDPQAYKQLGTRIEDEVTYYLLRLPNGRAIAAPVKQLILVCTANFGSDYQQATEGFDAAMLGRFAKILDFKPHSSEEVLEILCEHGFPQQVATVALQLRDFTMQSTAAHGGLLVRYANLRVMLHWVREARSLLRHEGLSWPDALTEACMSTIVPFVCTRLSDGSLEQPAVDIVIEELNRSICKAQL